MTTGTALLALIGDTKHNNEQMLVLVGLFAAASLVFALLVWQDNRHSGPNSE